MKFLLTELKKILTRRFFGILIVALLANFLLFWNGQSVNDTVYDEKSYLAAQQDLMAIEDSSQLEYVQEQYRMLQACEDWERYDYLIQSGVSNPGTISAEMLKYQQVYESGKYLKYTDTLLTERWLIRDLVSEVQQVWNHQTTLEAMIQEAKLKTSVSIFAEPGAFAYRTQLATIARFENLLYIIPSYDISRGVVKFQQSAATDLFSLILILFLCAEMVVTEHKNGMLPILRATRKGRLPLILSKIGTTFILTLFLVLALWGTNLIYCALTIGFGDLSRPIQSLSGFTACTLEVSVGEYLLLFLFLKWLLYSVVGILCLILGLSLQNVMATWLALGGFLCGEYILSQTVSAVSAWNILKYANVSNLIFTSEWLSEYRNLNLLEYPVEVLTVSYVIIAGALVLGVTCVCWLFCRRKVGMLPKSKFQFRLPRWLPRPGRSTALFGHELWKLFIECGTLLVLVLFIIMNLQEPRILSYSTEELCYKSYMEQLAGPMESEKVAFLEREAQRFADIHRQLSQLRQDHVAGNLSDEDLEMLSTPLERALKAEEILHNRIYPQIERISKLAENGVDAWAVYEPGYQYLFGVDGLHDKAGAAAILLAGLILCFSNFYPLETASGMQPLLNVYAKGRGATSRSKISISMILTALMFLVAQIPDYWYVIRNYGLPLLEAPLCSLEEFYAWGDSLSILGGMLIYEGLRLMTTMSLTAIILLICQQTRNQLMTMCISTGVLLLPLLLHLLGITFLDAVSFYRPMTGDSLLSSQNPFPLSVLYYGAVLALGIGSVWKIMHHTSRGQNQQISKR